MILGCTHYLYLKEFIQEYMGSHRKVVDPTLRLVSHLKRRELSQKGDLLQESIPLFVSGDVDCFAQKISKMFNQINFHVQKM